MNNCSKILLTIGLAVSLHLGLYPTTDIAMSATAPAVTVLPAITDQISAPVRLATDSAGNLYATDPHASGVLMYNSAGTLIKKYVTPKSGGGVAITQSGNLLVTQGTFVLAIEPVNGNEIKRFGTFLYANGIAIDGSGNIYVTDSRSNNVTKFDSNYNQVAQSTTATLSLARPAGIVFDKSPNANRLAIVNALSSSASIQFINTSLQPIASIGVRGYDPTRSDPTYPQFTYPQGVAFEYNTSTGVLERIYVVETFQANIQVLDATGVWMRDIGGYGFTNGKLYVPSDVLFDQKAPSNKRLLVANGGGTLAVYGIDSSVPQNYTLSLATSGAGTISGTGGIFVGPNTTTPIPFTVTSGSTVDLVASTTSSVFSSWTGACAAFTGNTCQVVMNSNLSASAIFINKQFNVNGAYYADLQAAYNAAPNGSVIKIMTGTWSGNVSLGTFTANLAKTVTLKGGYGADYVEPAVPGITVISGRINVKAGKVIMNNVRAK